mmetsp:Transcript_8990/g.30342  ORF Transcript_8990/g.30342 Transcript_8990/m.30342 type:complete len:120 (-) Transcript_8990:1095-1454(-)
MKSMPPPHPVCESKFMVLGLRRSFSDDIRETAEKTAKVMKYVFEGKFTLVFVFSLRKRRRMYALVNAIRTSILIAFATSSETGPSERWRIRVPPTLTSEHTKSQTLEELSSDDDMTAWA